ncbi:hypothetical protein IJT93_10325 [bacterium]|nr:hypothetical protein [bacterium]
MSKSKQPHELQKPIENEEPEKMNLLLEAGFIFSVSFWLRKSKNLFVSLFRKYLAAGALYKLFGALKSMIAAVLSKSLGKLLFNAMKSGWNSAIQEVKEISQREGLDFNADDIKTIEELCQEPPEEERPSEEPAEPSSEPDEERPEQEPSEAPASPPAEPGGERPKQEPSEAPASPSEPPSAREPEPDAAPSEEPAELPEPPAEPPDAAAPRDEAPAMEIGDNRFDPNLPLKEPDAETDSRSASDDFLPESEPWADIPERQDWTEPQLECHRYIRYALRRIDYFRETYAAQACQEARELLRRGINAGKPPAEIAEDIFRSVGGNLNRLRIIAVTETTWAVNVGRMAVYQQTPIVKGLRFRAVHTETTTEWCQKRDGLGLLWQEGLKYIRSQSPPIYFNCRSRWEPIITDDPEELDRIKRQRPLWDALERPDGFDNQLYDKDTPARWLTPGGYTIK